MSSHPQSAIIIQVLQATLGFLPRAWKAVGAKIRRVMFNIEDRRLPLSEEKALQICFAVLSGYILQVVPYRNINSRHVFMTCVRRESRDEHDSRIHILEQFGNTFRPIWSSEQIWSVPELHVADIDGDGIKEVVFVEESFGTGAGTRVMFVYSTWKRQLYQVRESYNWQDAAGPVSARIDVEPESEGEFLRAIEHYAATHGFLQERTVDIGDPNFAAQAWHGFNGRRKQGAIHLRFYSGTPRCRASISVQLETDDILWIAYFKGALFGYRKSTNEHFVAYSPSWIYDWITSMAFDGRTLWFAGHSDHELFSFRLEGDRGFLWCYTSVGGSDLPEIGTLRTDRGLLHINEQMEIPLRVLEAETRYLPPNSPHR